MAKKGNLGGRSLILMNFGVLEYWSVGVLEYWSDVLGVDAFFQHAITPSFHVIGLQNSQSNKARPK
jgi:hypothetical protein